MVSVTDEQVEALGDDELALIISRFSRFHNHCLNNRRGGKNQGCFGCGGPSHFVANYPKKNKHSSNKFDAGKRKDNCEYTPEKHKSKGGFDKDELKKRYIKKAKAQ